MVKLIFAVCVCMLSCVVSTLSQTSKMLPWKVSPPLNNPLVYRPEPILFIHGVNDNDGDCWSNALSTLQPFFVAYQVPNVLPIDTSYQQAQQNPYLHTFNYGCPPGVNNVGNHDLRTFEHIEWNVFDDDKNSRSFTNDYSGHLDVAPGVSDNRQTLDSRINGRAGYFVGIRDAYATTINGVTRTPSIVLVAHSMGGVLSHYYMLRKGANAGVRRLVTLATPHLGSPIANWLYSMKVVNPMSHWVEAFYIVPAVLHKLQVTLHRDEVGFNMFTANGAVEDLMTADVRDSSGCALQFHNDLQEYFFFNQSPKIEYVFNAYHHPMVTGYQAFRAACGPAWTEADHGDGLVPVWSAAGKHFHDESSIWNGFPGSFPAHDVDPVIFGTWEGLDHSDAKLHAESLLKSIDGVPYQWSGGTTNDWPWYAQTYGENQSFSKYMTAVESDGTSVHTDEPGIDGVSLLYSEVGCTNRLLIPALNTWTVIKGILQKVVTNTIDFVGHQIVGNTFGNLQCVGRTGAKNKAQTPLNVTTTNYCVAAGNEYLPASLLGKLRSDVSPIAPYTNAFATIMTFNIFENSLVQLDHSGNPQYQYGLFQEGLGSVSSAGFQRYVAVQGQNLAGLITPQAERAFDVPVDSETVVAILQKINQGEALSNGCHNAMVPTRWTASLREWGTTDTGTITLNFFPTRTNLNVVDAWITNSVFNDYTFTSAGNAKTIRINDANAAPSQLIVSYTAYLGCDKMFTNSDNGYVPALGKDTLAGVPINEAFLNIIRQKLEAIVPLFQNTDGGSCGGTNWVPTNILASAGYPSGTWLKVVNGLLLPEHFTQLKKVADKLTREYSQFTLIANATLDLKNVYHLPAGTNMVYSTQIIHGSCIPARLSVTSGALPPGLFLTNVTDTSASITGTPTSILWPNIAVTNNFVITATDTNSCSTNQVYSLVVSNTLDSWRLSGWWASANIGDGLVSGSHCLSIGSDLVQWRYCSSLNNCGDPTDPTCYCMYPEATSAMAACQAAPRSLGHVCTDMGAEIGSVDETVYYGWWDSLATNYVTDCNLYGIINSATNLCYGPNGVGILSDTDSSFSGVIPISGTYSFWHGQTPTNYSGCCSVSGTVYAAVVTWASNGTSTGTSPSTYPVFLPCIPP